VDSFVAPQALLAVVTKHHGKLAVLSFSWC
jgi:hypothetical protein